MSEFAAYYEAPPLSPAEQRLLEALTLPQHLEDSYKQAFETEIEALIDRQPTDERREFVRTGAQLHRWIHFGRPGEPLPPAYSVTYSSIAGSTGITYNTACAPIPSNIWSYITDNVKSIGAYQTQRRLPPLRGIIAGAIADVIRSQPQYQFLSSFLATPTHQTEQPLSSTTHAIRAAQVTESTVRRYGIQPEDFSHDNNASRAFRSGLGRLESETELRKDTASTQSAFERFNSWLLTNISRHVHLQALTLDLTAPSRNLTHIQLDPAARMGMPSLVAYTDKGEKIPLDANLLQDVIDEAIPKQIRSPYELPELARDLGYAFIYHLYAQDNKNLQNVLEVSVQEQAEQPSYDHVFDKLGPRASVIVPLRRPQSRLYETTYTQASSYRTDIIDDGLFSFNVLDKTVSEKSKKESIGTIAYQSPRVTGGRIILAQTAQANYPTSVNFYDLKLTLDVNKSLGRPDSGTAPAVPGMEVAARNGNTWYLTMSGHDPYRGSEHIPISAGNAAALAKQYDGLGMHHLAQTIRTHTGALHVADLVQYIIRSTEYTYDSSLPWHHYSPTAPNALDTFAPYVANGRLRAQCTGSSMFLAASLAIALPGCSPKPVHGHMLPKQGGDVSAIEHQQVIMLYGDKPYIVDATGHEEEAAAASTTPTHGERRSVASMIALGAFTVRSTLHQIKRSLRPQKEAVTPQDPRRPITPEYVQASHNAKLEQTVSNLEQMLQIIFQAESQKALYKHLATLPAHDPNRLAIAALTNAQQGSWQSSEETRAYIISYIQLDENQRKAFQKQYGIPVYTDRHMSLLAERLDAALRLAPKRARS